MKTKRTELSTDHLKHTAIAILEDDKYSKVDGTACADVIRRPERIYLKHGPKQGLAERIKESIKKIDL